MLRSVYYYTDRVSVWKPQYWSSLSRVFFLQDKQEAQRLLQDMVDQRKKKFAKVDWRPWLAENELASLPSAFTRLLQLAYFRKPVPDDLKSSITSQPLAIFTLEKGFLHISRPWIAACQQELGLRLVSDELLSVRKLPTSNEEFADYIHYIHQSTYRFLTSLSLPRTLENIYRGAVSYSEEIPLRGDLTLFPVLDAFDSVYNKERHVRCCSIKPHACENYDITPVRSHYFVLGRGMEETGSTDTCVLPTVLFSTNAKVPNRYKGNTEQQQLLIFDESRTLTFLRLFEIPIV